MLNRNLSGPESDKKEDYLPYKINELTEAIKLVAENELQETEERKKEALAQMRTKIADEKNLYSRLETHFLLQFLRSRKYDVNRAFRNLQTYYKFRKKYAFIYDNGENGVVHDVFRKNFIGFLPHRNKDGSVIVVTKLGMWEPAEVSRDLLLWTATHCAVYALEDEATQILGFTVILDLRGIGFRHYKHLTIENIKIVYHSVLFCFPGRVKAVHVIGLPPLFKTMYEIVQPFLLSSKMTRRILLHGNNLKSLHKHVPPCILPSDYGGGLGPFDNSEWHAGMLAMNDKGLAMRQYGYRD